MRLPLAFMFRRRKWRAGEFTRADHLTKSGTKARPLLRDIVAWCGRVLTNRWLLTAVTALTLAVATLSCLTGPQHPLKQTPCYWDVAQLPGRLALEVLQAVVWSMVRAVAELVR